MSAKITCLTCGAEKVAADFSEYTSRTGSGRRRSCKACERKKVRDRDAAKRDPVKVVAHAAAEKARAEKARAAAEKADARAAAAEAAAVARRASDYAPLRPEDFDVGLDGDPDVSHLAGTHNLATRANASKEKRQEYNAAMGKFASDLRDAALNASGRGGEVVIPEDNAGYIGKLAEQEKRFGNRRMARSVAIAEAHEEMSRKAAMWVAERYFSSKVEPAGYARIKPDTKGKRTACLLLSDLHLGSELDSLDEPVSFKATEEARRLEFVLRQLIDYKPQYRSKSSALIIINGDIIEGQLMHDFRAGAPLTEQKAIFWTYFREFVSQVAAHYPSVHIECQAGNHGRDKVRHPGRATARKWDGHEWEMYFALRMMCSDLRNVTWSIPFRAVSAIELHGSHILATHADTEVKVGDPDTKAKENARILDRINSTKMYGVTFQGAVFGHYHKPRFIPGDPSVIFNGPLVPPNGHARTSGYIGETCGQFLWEAVEGFPIGDVRYIQVGPAQDHDERLGTIIKPFRFSDDD